MKPWQPKSQSTTADREQKERSPFAVRPRAGTNKELEGVKFGALKNNPFLKMQEESKKAPLQRKFTPPPVRKTTPKVAAPPPEQPRISPIKKPEPPIITKPAAPIIKAPEEKQSEKEESDFIDKAKLAQRQPRPSVLNSTMARPALGVAKLQAMFIQQNLQKESPKKKTEPPKKKEPKPFPLVDQQKTEQKTPERARPVGKLKSPFLNQEKKQDMEDKLAQRQKARMEEIQALRAKQLPNQETSQATNIDDESDRKRAKTEIMNRKSDQFSAFKAQLAAKLGNRLPGMGPPPSFAKKKEEEIQEQKVESCLQQKETTILNVLQALDEESVQRSHFSHEAQLSKPLNRNSKRNAIDYFDLEDFD